MRVEGPEEEEGTEEPAQEEEEPVRPPVLALPGPEHAGLGAGLALGSVGRTVRLEPQASRERTGHALWDGAVEAARYVEGRRDALRARLLERPNADKGLELGSGTGLAGIATALLLGVEMELTDLDAVVPALRRNVVLNGPCPCSVGPLDWRDAMHRRRRDCGLVLAADCVWLPELVEPFVLTLAAVAPPGALVLLAYQERSIRVSDRLFTQLAPHFERLAVASRELPRSGKSIEIYEFVRRPD